MKSKYWTFFFRPPVACSRVCKPQIISVSDGVNVKKTGDHVQKVVQFFLVASGNPSPRADTRHHNWDNLPL